MTVKLVLPCEHILQLPYRSTVALGIYRRLGGKIISRQIVAGRVAIIHSIKRYIGTIGNTKGKPPTQIKVGTKVGYEFMYPCWCTGKIQHGHRISSLMEIGARCVEQISSRIIYRSIVITYGTCLRICRSRCGLHTRNLSGLTGSVRRRYKDR